MSETNGTVNGGVHQHDASSTMKPESTSNFQGGGAISRFITPGGNPMDNSQPAFPVFHRE